MLNRIIHFSIRNKLLVGLFTLGLIIYGAVSITKLPIDAVPDITNNQVQVITVAPSLAAPEVERLITFPVEQANANIPGLTEIRSFSRFGLSLVTIVFNDDVNVYWARQQVSERLQQVKDIIPKGTGIPTMGPVSSGLGEIFQYVVKAKPGYEGKYDAMQLRTIQDWIVRRQLLGTSGIADVSSFGGYLKQYEIAVNDSKLKSLNITIDDVFTAIEKNNQNTGGSYIEKGPAVFFIRTEGLIGNLDEIGKIVVKNIPSGIPVLLKDVAEVRIGHATRYGAMCYNDKGEVAGAVVMMLKGENSSRVIKNVKERIKQIEKTLPEGVMLEPFLDRTKMVNNAIGTVEKNLVEGALIVIFILVVFLGNLRAGLVVASVIPLSMLFAVIMMNLFGVSGNLMSLGALDFGLIVDGAVIIVEAVMHRITKSHHFSEMKKLTQHQVDEEVKFSAGKMMNSAVFGQIIILIVYLPILSLQGIEGKMFKPMAQTVSFAILGAFILSLTYVPMITSLLLSKKVSHKKSFADKMMSMIENWYKPALLKAIHWPKTILGLALLFFIGSVWIMMGLGGEFIPQLEEGDFAVDTRVLTGSSLSTTIQSTQKAVSILIKEFPEIEKVVTKIGSGEIPTDPMPLEASDMMIILKDKKEWKSAKSFPELADKMSNAIRDVPGVTAGFQFPVQMRFNELMTGAKQDVVCKVFGEDLDSLASYAGKLGQLTGKVDGAKDLYVETVTGLPQIVVNYNREAIAKYGLSIKDVNRAVQTAFAGESGGLIYEGEKRFDLVVRLDNTQRKDVTDVQNLLISTPKGIQIPLNQVAIVEIKDGPNQIQREDTKRRITVGFNVRNRDIQTVVNELQNLVQQQLKFSPGYYITYGGQFQNLQEAKQRLTFAVPLALLLIFVLLYFAFNSIKHGLLIFSAIPLSAIGGVLALWLRGMPFSISAGVGFIALFGVAVLNGIVLIAEFNQLKEEGLTDVRDIVVKGTHIRLRPVLMTATVASLGFLPMALSHGAGAEVQRPLATVVIGGLITATFLTLVVLPILYILFEEGFKRKKKMKKHIPAVILFFFCSSIQSMAQSNIKATSLEEMIKTATSANLFLQNEKLIIQYRQQLIGTAKEISKTSLSTEYGQINSAEKDNRIGVTQTIAFPSVYTKGKAWLTEEVKTSEWNSRIKENELVRKVKLVYYNWLYLQYKKKLLQNADTIYNGFLQRAELRLKAGEANLLEKTNAETQQLQIAAQLEQLEADIKILQDELQLLTNSSQPVQPLMIDLKRKMNIANDSSAILKNPVAGYLEQLSATAIKQTAYEKAKLSPDILLGYNNQSIIGWQKKESGTESFYSSSKRFSTFQLGLLIPVFNTAQKSRIKAAQLNEKIATGNKEASLQLLQSNYRQAYQQYEKTNKTLTLYEEKLMPQSKVLISNADIKFRNGEINYLEWAMLVNNAVTIQSDHINAQYNFSKSVIELEYLIGNN
ncbi:MAG: CusA/CzcA family heavy metal efflux RND transporter [Sphingobacteriales bacterium]|nr:CusA/CzcA family heavy metal efflux RND transporter [Sphingobacteriales bacterium]